MARRKKMNAEEMEKWLLSQGAKPVTKKMQKEPWYAEVSKLPSCMMREKKQLNKQEQRLFNSESFDQRNETNNIVIPDFILSFPRRWESSYFNDFLDTGLRRYDK